MGYRTRNNSTIQTRALSLKELDAETIQKWNLLESNSQSENPFLAPGFILPYLKNRQNKREPVFLVCENVQDRRLVGLGIFEHVQATKLLPLPHLVPFQCEHVLRRGFLIAKDRSTEFIESLLDFMSHGQERWFGIEFGAFRLNQPWVEELREQAGDFGCSFRLQTSFHSPAVNLTKLDEKGLAGQWSSSRRKKMRRNLNRLSQLGEVSFRANQTEQELAEALERFLKLEHSGWKKEQGTSILSCENDRKFVQEMVSEMAKNNRILISELLVGQEVAACAINLICEHGLFAYKIGHDQKYAQVSPGLLHESLLVDCMQQSFPQITWMDGCARPNSYLDKIWLDRIPIGEGLLSVSTLARKLGGIMSRIRITKQWASTLLGE